MIKLTPFKKPRCAGMSERGARPEDSHTLFNPGVGHAAVVRGASLACCSELAKDVVRNGVRKVILTSQTACKVSKDLPVHSCIAGGRDGLLQLHASAFTGCHGA